MIKKSLIALALASSAFLGIATGQSKAETTTVYQADLATSFADVISNPTKWLFYNDETDTIDTTLGLFVVGPSTPPLGLGSAQISVSGTQRRNLATYQFSGVKLSDINVLKYSTYNPSVGNGGSLNRSGFLYFNVDFNNSDAWQGRLAYVPSLNGVVLQDTWQEWDAISNGNALWQYPNRTWPGGGDGNTPKTINQILAIAPDTRIRVTDSSLGIRVGEPYFDGYTENIDSIKFGTISGVKIFDFESGSRPSPTPNPYAVPTQCSSIAFAGAPIVGTNGSDKIIGTNGNDLIFALNGSDKVDGKGGDDCIVGGDGSDKLIGGNGKDIILGGNGSDAIEGNDQADILYGEEGSDGLKGGLGSDELYGGEGSDSLKGEEGNDIIIGGNGSDSANGGADSDTCTAETKKQCEV